MMKKAITLAIVVSLILAPTEAALAQSRAPLVRATASALVPGLGQILNNEQATWGGRAKIAAMLGLELGALIATPALARSGFPEVMIGIGMLAVNHVWSASDAYRNALQLPEVRMAGWGAR
ncbi:MAG: hypothetical protein A3G87_04920 [Omnitrophica bacterium RIFCSPLOWO2_12_FULL_50_11]|nr:MAG: hypothetical protein A3G87_04920 [Omnitrophica bacterium RIFCSPLOWO2_12_FULL_50_11]